MKWRTMLALATSLAFDGIHPVQAGAQRFVLEVDRLALARQDVEGVRRQVRALAEAASPSTQVLFQTLGMGIRVVLPTEPARTAMLDALRRLALPLPGGRHTLDVRVDAATVFVLATPAGIDEHVRAIAGQAVAIIGRRLDAAGLAGARVERLGDDRIGVQVPDKMAPEAIKTLLVSQGKLEFRSVLDPGEPLRDGESLTMGEEGRSGEPVRVRRAAILTGSDIADARSLIDARTNEPVVGIHLSPAAAARFARFTSDNVGGKIAIVLDGKVLSAPRIMAPISDGDLQISGRFTSEQAARMALLVRSGALPAPLILIEEQSLGSAPGK